jgi:hypothetical protein
MSWKESRFPPFIPAQAEIQGDNRSARVSFWVSAFAGTNGQQQRPYNSYHAILRLACRIISTKRVNR